MERYFEITWRGHPALKVAQRASRRATESVNDRGHLPSESLSYLRTATHDRLVGRLKNAAQLREALVLHLEHDVRPRRAVVVEIIIVAHQLLRAADIAEYRVRLHPPPPPDDGVGSTRDQRGKHVRRRGRRDTTRDNVRKNRSRGSTFPTVRPSVRPQRCRRRCLAAGDTASSWSSVTATTRTRYSRRDKRAGDSTKDNNNNTSTVLHVRSFVWRNPWRESRSAKRSGVRRRVRVRSNTPPRTYHDILGCAQKERKTEREL